MINEFNRLRASDDLLSLTELELLEALMAHDGAYPWDPTDPEAEAYFIEQEQKNPLLQDWSEEEISTQAQTFFSQVEQIWEEIAPASHPAIDTDVKSLQATLQQRFEKCIPQNWIQAIARKASEVFTTQKSIADQLVQCVQELLPNWAEDDLLVLARPLAYTMRNPDPAVLESVLSNICSQEWIALSEIEQVRAGLSIARYALAQLQTD